MEALGEVEWRVQRTGSLLPGLETTGTVDYTLLHVHTATITFSVRSNGKGNGIGSNGANTLFHICFGSAPSPVHQPSLSPCCCCCRCVAISIAVPI